MPSKVLISKIYPVTGMHCASCAVRTETFVKTLPGVSSASVNYADTSLNVEFSPEEISPDKMKQAIRDLGYDIIIDEANSHKLKEADQKEHLKEARINTIGAAILSIPLLIIAMVFMDIPFANYIMMALASPVVFWFGRQFPVGAIKQLKHGSANMDTLVALSTSIAFVYSAIVTFFPHLFHREGISGHVYFEAAAVIITFILLGRLLEEKAKSNTSTALKKLIGLQSKSVTIITDDGSQKEIPADHVIPGNIILVRPGTKIPVDGIVTYGSTFIDESMLSGEPIPIEKSVGAKVFAGTINQKGSIHFRAEKVGSDTLLSQIIKMVREAQGSKAPVQHLVDKIAGIFVPVVMTIGLVSGIAWFFLAKDNNLIHSLMSVVTVLIIACPCALGLATPTAIMVGIGKGADNGILIKDAESLETAHKVNAVVLDKTGTITLGEPVVNGLLWKKDLFAEKYSRILHGIEKSSEHPLAAPVVRYLEDSGIASISLQLTVESITGRGIKAVVEGESYFIGNKSLMDEQGIKIDDELRSASEKWQDAALSVSFFSDNTKVLSAISISDKIKESSKEAIKNLHELGIEVYMLTGDNEQSASAIAKEAGVDSYKAGMLPQDKHDFIKELQSQGKIVAMAGDGINDSQALAQADVSIAMGKGSDIAIDVAKMTIISSDLTKIPQAIKLSRLTVRTIRQNLFWAFIYNIIGIPIAAGVLYPFTGFLLNPMIAGAAMALSSVSVVSNSLLLKAYSLSLTSR
jgi:Cu2+-exporting ATPase